MNDLELKKIALRFVNKGYYDEEVLRYSDDLYSATDEDRDTCCDFLEEIKSVGITAFEDSMPKELKDNED